jgi:hypothetical protein
MAVKTPYMYDRITKLCRKQAEVIQNHLSPRVCAIGPDMHRKHMNLNLAMIRPTTVNCHVGTVK